MIRRTALNQLSQSRQLYAAVIAVVAFALMSILFALVAATPRQITQSGPPLNVPAEAARPSNPARTNQPAGGADQPVAQAADGATRPAEPQIVTRINGATVDLATFLRTYELNQVLSSFVTQETDTSPHEQLDQLINTTLVAQAAHAAGFQLQPGETEQALAAWLASHQKTERELEETLAAKGFTPAEFTAHFQQLLLVDGYLRQQAARQGQAQEAVLQQLQAQAKISFGAAANHYLAADESAPTQAVTNPAVAFTATAPTSALAQTQAALDGVGADQPQLPFLPFQSLTDQDLVQSSARMTDTSATAGVTTTQALPPVPTEPTPTAAPIGLAPGNRAPTFTLPLLDPEQPARNLTDWLGTPIVLSFWTTWCPYCRKQTPVLVAADRLTTTQPIQFLGINVNESPATVQAYVEAHQVSYPILLDSVGEVANRYAVRGYPTTYFIRADGHIMAKHVGVLDEAQLSQYMTQLTP